AETSGVLIRAPAQSVRLAHAGLCPRERAASRACDGELRAWGEHRSESWYQEDTRTRPEVRHVHTAHRIRRNGRAHRRFTPPAEGARRDPLARRPLPHRNAYARRAAGQSELRANRG